MHLGQCDGCESGPSLIGPDGLCTWHRAESSVPPSEVPELFPSDVSDVIGNL